VKWWVQTALRNLKYFGSVLGVLEYELVLLKLIKVDGLWKQLLFLVFQTKGNSYVNKFFVKIGYFVTSPYARL
jgi:hypothetical protein